MKYLNPKFGLINPSLGTLAWEAIYKFYLSQFLLNTPNKVMNKYQIKWNRKSLIKQNEAYIITIKVDEIGTNSLKNYPNNVTRKLKLGEKRY